jgi:hypothetical protein
MGGYFMHLFRFYVINYEICRTYRMPLHGSMHFQSDQELLQRLSRAGALSIVNVEYLAGLGHLNFGTLDRGFAGVG